MKTVAILCARADSIYKIIEGCDVFDAARDARTFAGGMPVVAHAPCRAWGELRHMARPRDGEMDLGLWCADKVRENGGVFEHPKGSTLFTAAGLPHPGERDAAGGFTLAFPQMWFGHRAEKWSWFYVCGISPAELPEMPFTLGEAPCIIGTPGRRADGSRLKRGDAGWRPEVTKREREATPPLLSAWLVETARRCAAVTV